MQFLQSALFRPGFVPTAFRKYRIPAAGVISYQQGGLNVFTQRIRLQQFTIQFHIFEAKEKTLLFPRNWTDLLTTHYMMKGSIDAFLNSGGYFPLRELEHNMFMVKGAQSHTAILEPGTYWCLHIDLESPIIEMLDDKVLFFKKLRQVVSPTGGTINPQPFHTSAAEVVLLNEILTCELKGKAADIYLTNRATELLLAYGVQLADSIATLFTDEIFTDQEIANLIALNSYMCTHLEQTHNLATIAAMFQFSVSRMDQGYQHIFNCTVDKYLEAKRMMKAYELLHSTILSDDEIAEKIGLPPYKQFETRFLEFFGKLPDQIRGENNY